MSSGNGRSMRALASLGGLAFSMAALIVLGALLGHYLDRRWGTAPWLTFVGTLLGIAAGFFEVFTQAKKAERDESGPGRK